MNKYARVVLPQNLPPDQKRHITKKVRSSYININQRLQQGEESTTKETSILTPYTRLITRGATLTLTLAGVGRRNSNDAPV